MIRESAIGRVMTCSQPACGNIFKPACNPTELLPTDGFIMDQARGAGWLVPSREFALCPHHAPATIHDQKIGDTDDSVD